MHIAFLNPQGNFDPNDSYWTEHPDFGGQLVYVKEVATAMAALGHRVDILTLGQYLSPSPKHLPVVRYISPDEFADYRNAGVKMGFAHVESGPLVRSSYHADGAEDAVDAERLAPFEAECDAVDGTDEPTFGTEVGLDVGELEEGALRDAALRLELDGHSAISFTSK